MQKNVYSEPPPHPLICGEAPEVSRAAAAYRVVGVMSGTSLDGVDLALVLLHPPAAESGEMWGWKLEAAQTVPLPPGWRQFFSDVTGKQTPNAQELVQADVEFGRYLGEIAQIFLASVGGALPDFIASHRTFDIKQNSARVADHLRALAQTRNPFLTKSFPR